MADVIVKNKRTGVEQEMPYRVWQQVQGMWKFVRYVDESPNVKNPSLQKEKVAVGAADEDSKPSEEVFVFPDDLDKLSPEQTEDIESIRQEYITLTGENPGKKSAKTLLKEINKIKGHED